MSTEKYCIYIIQNKINNKIYVGQTNKPDHRWCQHQRDCLNPKTNSYNMAIGRAIRKYGSTNFDFFILEGCSSLKEANNAEEFWIQYLNTQDKNIGYNIKSGGDNYKQSDETKRKIGAGNRIALKGKKHSEEHNKNISRGLLKAYHNKPRKYKITLDQALEIRELYEAGSTQVEISKIFDIDQSHVSRIINKYRRIS
jgi:group I intron endonuclease